ncbi:hypothetical protein ACHHYP_20036 [Achlya hypogyna]|uniref:Pentacotripeptide-repeat region of PRORP domain-containing protein n=1 Tax=Achlya hypogyna TaxID=1202772 RepID=A0A1V9ZA35_ACHHY|nr:hypothetical protein ACHHYP_20036 [Achlya hypogyna]
MMLRGLLEVPRRLRASSLAPATTALRLCSTNTEAVTPIRHLKIKIPGKKRPGTKHASEARGARTDRLGGFEGTERFQEAVEAFHALEDKTESSYRCAMEAQFGLFAYQAVVDLYLKAAKSFSMSPEARLLYVLALNRQKKFAHTMAAYEDWAVAGEPLSAPTYNAVLVACGHTKDWKLAQKIMTDMQAASLEPQGAAYFHVLSATLRDPAVPVATPLGLAEAAMAAGYPVSTSLLGHLLILAAKDSGATLARAMRVWEANMTFGSIVDRHEFQYEIMLQTLWKLQFHAEANTLLRDLVGLRHPSADFKSRITKDLLRRHLAVHDLAGATALLALMVEAGMPALVGRSRHELFSVCLRSQSLAETQALFDRFRAVTNGWDCACVCDLLVWGHKAAATTADSTEHQYQQLMKLLSHAFDRDWHLSYGAMDHAVRWLLHLKRYDDCAVFVDLLLENPNVDVGYRITETGMTALWHLGRHSRVTELYLRLAQRHRSHPTTKDTEFAPRPYMINLAIRSHEALKQFEDARHLKALLAHLHPHKVPTKKKPAASPATP